MTKIIDIEEGTCNLVLTKPNKQTKRVKTYLVKLALVKSFDAERTKNLLLFFVHRKHCRLRQFNSKFSLKFL
jgi:hypothetical protein